MSSPTTNAAPLWAPAPGSAPMRVGLIGLGAIGQSVCRLAADQGRGIIEIVGAIAADPPRGDFPMPRLFDTLDEVLAERPEVVLEAAGHEGLRQHGPKVLRAGVDLITMGVGALADDVFREELLAAAREGQARVRICSGAIGGLDAIASASHGHIEKVTHTTTKPARILMDPAEAEQLTEPKEVYRGVARQAVFIYPESVNVMSAVSLAGIGFDRTEVRVIADPRATRNKHEVRAEGFFGVVTFEIQNIPSNENPKTGHIVGMSAFHALLNRRAMLMIG